MVQLEGVLLAYWEQGWEGRIEFAFQPNNAQHPLFLGNGDLLTIYGLHGDILWSGEIVWVPVRFWDRHRVEAGIWSYFKQKGALYASWMRWFWNKPPLKACLKRKGEHI